MALPKILARCMELVLDDSREMITRVTYTDAQIKALPTTPLTCLPAQSASLLVIPKWAVVWVKAASGAYTNIDATAFLGFKFATSLNEPMSWVPNDAAITAGTTTNFTSLFGTANNRRALLLPGFRTENVNEWGLVPSVVTSTDGVNQALQIYMGNGAAGNLTGGNASNSMIVDFGYVALRVP